MFHIPATTGSASEENQTEPGDQFIEYQFIMPCNPILSLFSPYQGQNNRNS